MRREAARFRGAGMLAVLAPALLTLVACSARHEADAETPVATAGRFVLAIESAETEADGRRCILRVTARNGTGAAALNVQAAWMVQTDGFGIISDYQRLGDFATDETRSLQLGVSGAPCDAIRDVKLTRAVCATGPAADPPQSCSDLVMLDGGGVIAVR